MGPVDSVDGFDPRKKLIALLEMLGILVKGQKSSTLLPFNENTPLGIYRVDKILMH